MATLRSKGCCKFEPREEEEGSLGMKLLSSAGQRGGGAEKDTPRPRYDSRKHPRSRCGDDAGRDREARASPASAQRRVLN
ncbi:hypothetical protein OJAV_G00195290 [Oryzias javanicus]|uniref:Uncharacterized protein n=1 Tax=Oryzias javanicus TaxID=123683 RepID=A0A3S2PDH1_ORYJA|nr:hypothetical protein OJAV_G00195290 [Oryzias javanicus]